MIPSDSATSSADARPADLPEATWSLVERLKFSRRLLEGGEVERARLELTGALAALGSLAAVPEKAQVVDVTLLDELNLIARLEGEHSRFDSMAVMASCAARIAQQWGCALQEAEASRMCATAANFTGHFGEAAGLLRRAAELFAAAGDSSGQAKCLINLGSLLTNLGEHAEALAALFQCHQLVSQYGNGEQLLHAPCLVNIGHTYHAMRQHGDAQEYLQLGLDAARSAADPRTEVAALGMLGLLSKDTGHHAQAISTLSRGLELATLHGFTHDLIDLSDSLGQVYLDSGDHHGAQRMHQRSLDAALAEDDPQGVSNALLGLGRAAAGLGQLEEAVDTLTRALEVTRRHALRGVELALHAELSSCFERLAQDGRALAHHKEFHRLERSLFSEQSETRTRNLTARHAAERARLEAETYRQVSEMAQRAREEAEQTVALRTRELEEAQIEMVTRLGSAGEYRDDLTGEHTARVGELSYRLGVAIGMPPEEAQLLKWAARLHDIGKIGISDAVLLKPGRYTPDEYDRMKLHTVIGARMLEGSRSRLLRMAEQIALTHHERWDGQGYPRGLAGTDIPLAGRIVAVADVYDALTSDRPYKQAWHPAEALGELRSGSGSLFDPQVVQALERILPGTDQTGGPATPAKRRETVLTSGQLLPGNGVEASAGPQPAEPRRELDHLIETAWELRHSDPQKGEQLATEALARAEQLHDVRALGYAYRTLGFFHFAAARYEEALSMLSKGLEFGAHLEDTALQIDCANFSAAVYNSLTHYEKAIEMLSLTMRISRSVGDLRRTANTLHNLGIVTIDSRDYDRAATYLSDALSSYRQLKDAQGEAQTLGTSSRLALERGQYSQAVELGTQALALLRQHPNPLLEATASLYLGKAYRQQGEFAASVASLTLTLEGARSISHFTMEGWAQYELGATHLSASDFAAAHLHLQEARQVAQTASQRTLELQVLLSLAQLYEAQGEATEALIHYRLHHEAEREIFTQEAALRTRALTIELEVERTKADMEVFKVRSIELTAANEALERVNAEKSKLLSMLETQSKLLERQVSEDALTGLYNRRHAEQTLAREFRQHKESGGSLTVAMIDLDHFKQINDRFSHMVGDQVLRQVAALFREVCRPSDLVARYGGEEFLIVFPNTTLEQGKRVCERIARQVAGYAWHELQAHLQVTLSVGVAADLSVQNHEKLLSLADAQLYQAKDNGRNQVRG